MEALGVRVKCCTLLIDGPEDADPWGREALYHGETRVGRLTSGGYSVHFEKSIGMGYLPPELAVPGTKLAGENARPSVGLRSGARQPL
jgi:dimethylglycine dehydrogenase